MTVRPGFLTFATSFPEVGLFGAVFPFASLTTTPANELAVGFTHDSDTDDDVTLVTLTDLTGPGAVVAAHAAAGDHSANPTATAERPAQARPSRRDRLLPARTDVIADLQQFTTARAVVEVD